MNASNVCCTAYPRGQAMKSQCSQRLLQLCFVIGLIFLALTRTGHADDAGQIEAAKALLQFGFSTGVLVWKSLDGPPKTSTGDRYIEVAQRLKAQLEQGRAVSSVVQSNFDVAATILAYEATVNP